MISISISGVLRPQAPPISDHFRKTLSDDLPRGAGRSLAVVPREEDPSGILDLNIDDFPEDSKLQGWQMRALRSSARDLVSDT